MEVLEGVAKLEVLKPPPPSALAQLVADYLAHLRARGLSPRTVQQAADVLERQWLPWCGQAGVGAPEELDQRLLERWSAFLLEEHRTPAGAPLSRASVRTYLRVLGSFLRWAQSEQAVGPAVKVRLPREEHRLVETLSREEIQRLEDAASSERDRLMIRLLADTGIRLGELLGLRHEDLLEEGRERYLRVRGKGARERLVPLAPGLFQRLRRYAQRGGRAAGRVFLTTRRSARTGEYEPVQPRSIQNALAYAAEVAGIQRRVHPHLMRHSYATWALRRGMNPLQLQRILGHADLTMISQTYSHLTASDSYQAMIDLLRTED